MQQKMNALVYEGPRQMNMKEIPRPHPQKDEVLIQVAYAGICGSELSGYLGQNSLRVPPLVMGHEFAGTVQEVGAAVTGLHKGERVAVNPLISCGVCKNCRAERAQLCDQRQLLGAHVPGAYADYVAVPARNVYRLPDAVSLQQAALAEPLACAIHIVRQADLRTEDRLFIAGAGPIGLFTLIAAKLIGSNQIVVQDINSERLAIVRELGGTAATGAEHTAGKLDEFTVAVDAVGLDVTRQQCMQVLEPGGRLIFSGLHAACSELPINDAVRKELVLRGAFAYARTDFELALTWLAESKVHFERWMMEAPLAEGKVCFEKLLTNPGNIAKIVLKIETN